MNFGAGPAKLPTDVLKEIQENLLSCGDTPLSVMEVSHRGPIYQEINKDALESVRKLLSVPNNYKIMFVHGGSAGVFSSVCLNLLGRTGVADYVVTGIWSELASKEASKYGKINMVLPKCDEFTSIPDQSKWKLDSNASYVYYCDNETVNGLAFDFVPETNGVPLVCDMCSSIFLKPLDISKYGMIFGSSHKNFGTAGIALVIIREDLIGHAMPLTPATMDYKMISDFNSILNTPPIFVVYVTSRVLKWVEKNGGLTRMNENLKTKSELIYNEINASNGFFVCKVEPKYRSKSNIPFSISGSNGTDLEEMFIKGAEDKGMYQLRGHKLVGGIRISLYNAVPVEDTEKLAKYMQEFYKNNNKS